jgi:hypothetical protein
MNSFIFKKRNREQRHGITREMRDGSYGLSLRKLLEKVPQRKKTPHKCPVPYLDQDEMMILESWHQFLVYLSLVSSSH